MNIEIGQKEQLLNFQGILLIFNSYDFLIRKFYTKEKDEILTRAVDICGEKNLITEQQCLYQWTNPAIQHAIDVRKYMDVIEYNNMGSMS
ncbi:hypothetical protein Glove_707g73 [Diversispora epigaea]|uniref:Uncharacterized protein n=1 Tax=Diversispora epigaea TaxID=1348612 RepID=A0A397G2Q6_9GLOM|nr:hypothetical protein Glove_707g73 [Diversispora epigaea]